ncbi:hypothetical protein [Pseudoxanthomonas sp. USHLN014]|uniref:hypothetical protein n=1 Tax=Pseudoxanthomonas sp. USHLN014 TaxID=3081297 RepID=UPI00301CA9CD
MAKHISTSTWMEVDVDLSLDDLAQDLEVADIQHLTHLKGVPLSVGLGFGDGDPARLRGIVDAAERSVRSMASVPRELLDLMYYVHGRAIA